MRPDPSGDASVMIFEHQATPNMQLEETDEAYLDRLWITQTQRGKQQTLA